MILLLLLAQAATPAPDIELNATIRAKSVTIEKRGEARLTVTTDPDGGNLIDVQAPKANGRKKLRNVEVRIDAEARIGDPTGAPQNNQAQPETPSPQ